jgi:hypothetical protein
MLPRGRSQSPDRQAVTDALMKLGLSPAALDAPLRKGASTWPTLQEYFIARRDLLHQHVKPNLMDAAQAKHEFTRFKRSLKPSCPLPMNKQKGKKKAFAYLTGIVNMLIEANAAGVPCDYDPRALTTVAANNIPLRTFARRMDGAFPSVINPIAVWEVKEYYYTTTFGSRVADGVYESLLDGMEIEELSVSEKINVLHYLMIDARYTWWECGKSYLCRLIDMLHMGYVDEVLVGREVNMRLPALVREWSKLLAKRNRSGTPRERA